MNQPELGQKIVELRKQKGITQEELVNMCNINVRTIQRIESGAVTPRSFTLNLIFSCLDYKYEEKPIKNKFLRKVYEHFARLLSGNFNNIPPNVLANKFLKTAFIAGILFLFFGLAISGLDFLRANNRLFVTGNIFYILLKLLNIVAAAYFFGGFIVIGSKLKNNALVISSLILAFAIALFSCYDILSLFYNAIEKEMIDGARAIIFGIIAIVFGIGVLRLTRTLGTSALLAGLVNILEGLFFLSIVLWFIGSILTIPAILFEIALLYKAYKNPQLLELSK